MSDQVVLAAIGLVNTCVLVYFGIKQNKQGNHIQEIKVATDGMQERLQEAAHAKGVLDEKGRAAIETQDNQNK